MTLKKIRFYDTSSLLKERESLFEEPFIISSITLNELERIKTSYSKDTDIKFAARRLLHLLDENRDKYEVRIFTKDMLEPFDEKGLEITDDIRILATAYSVKEEVEFYTNDLALKHIAGLFFDNVYSIKEIDDNYTGYADIIMSDEEMDRFYSNPTLNNYDLNVNQYINVYNKDNELVDTQVWDGTCFSHITYGEFKSKWFGKIKPYKGDINQAMAFDSLLHNQMTVLFGRPGSGKTMLSLGYLFSALEAGELDKIVIICNPVAARESARLGFTPGDLIDKILDTQVGNVLMSKLGDRIGVEEMINKGKIELIPASNIRGYSCEGVVGYYVTECQNLSVYLLKLILQRAGDECKVILDGDLSQIDYNIYDGANNGLRRVIDVFKGQSLFGCVQLNKTHRSKICEIAEKM